MTMCLKSLLLAIQQYRDCMSTQNTAKLQKQVEVNAAPLLHFVSLCLITDPFRLLLEFFIVFYCMPMFLCEAL